MATVPRSATQIKLLENVPFHSDYKHTRWFDNLSSQTAFFNSREVRYQAKDFNVIKLGAEYRIKVPFFIDDIRRCNYLMFQNKNKWYYAFISRMEYNNPSNTEIFFTLDVIQTYMFEFEFNPSFVVREHQDPGKMNTIIEGLDYGTDYDTVHVSKFVPNEGLKFMVVISKSPLHDADEDDIVPSIIGVPQPLQFYVIPFWPEYVEAGGDMASPMFRVDSATGGTTGTGPINALSRLYESESATNNIVSIYITEDIGLEFNIKDRSEGVGYIEFKNTARQHVDIVEESEKSVTMLHVKYITQFQYKTQRAVTNYKDYFSQTYDDKLRVAPYVKIIMDDMKGNRIELDPEKINGSHIEMNIKGGLGHSNHISYGIQGYNYVKGNNIPFENELINETSIVNSNPQDVAILNDHLAAYMQGNRNSLQAQQSSMAFNALFGGFNTGMGVAGSIGSGNAMGTIGSIAGGIQGLGNTALQIQGLEAQLKDIETTPPGLNSMGSSSHFDFGHQYTGVYFIFKQIKSEYRRKLNDYFKMFGYKQNEVKIPNIKTRQHFNYIQTTSCHIKGSFNNEDLNEIKHAFDSGITLWHTDDVGNYNLSNGQR